MPEPRHHRPRLDPAQRRSSSNIDPALIVAAADRESAREFAWGLLNGRPPFMARGACVGGVVDMFSTTRAGVAAALEVCGGCEVMLPLVAGATAVILAAAVACTPALVQAARVAPAELLRREQVESVE